MSSGSFQENISLNESFNIIYICDIKKECLNTLKVYFAKYSIFMLSMYFLNFQTFKLDLEKSEEPKIKLPTSIGSQKKKENSKKIYFCFIDATKDFDCVDHNKLLKILKKMGISDHLTYLLRNLYAGQEATVRTGHGTTDWFQIGKGVHPGCIMSPCLFNLYAEYILQNAGLNESQARIKIAGRNINNLRYADDTTFMAESQEELKSLLMRVKGK